MVRIIFRDNISSIKLRHNEDEGETISQPWEDNDRTSMPMTKQNVTQILALALAR
jgi:hypothetical protein